MVWTAEVNANGRFWVLIFRIHGNRYFPVDPDHPVIWYFPVDLRPGPSRAADESVYPVTHSNPTVFRLFA